MATDMRVTLPETGANREQVLAALRDAQRNDVDWQGGRLQGLVYAVGADVMSLAEDAYLEYFHTNPLSPSAFPSLKRFEDEIVGMVSGL
ncbi:MAG: aspartate aminotransferase family protein, partial [Chloroflexi bacterium]